jgi:hypothetical protein
MNAGACRPVLAAVAFGLLAPSALPASKPAVVELVCEPVYMPARSVWRRTVQIAYNDQGVVAVVLDGVPAFSFSVAGTVIQTALDNERIQVDVAGLNWRSDYRGLASAQGACERRT